MALRSITFFATRKMSASFRLPDPGRVKLISTARNCHLRRYQQL